MNYEYKCIGAPEEPRRRRGVRAWSDRVALAMQEVITAEAVDGWEYLRADLLPVEEKDGFFSRARRVQRAVLVFRREIGRAQQREPTGTEPTGTAPTGRSGAVFADDRTPPRQTAGQPATGRQLAAERGVPAPPSDSNRLPSTG